MKTALLAGLLLAPQAAAPDAEALFAQGVQAYAAEDYERAMSAFEQAARLEPSASRYQHWLGKATGRRAERVNPLRAAGLAGKVRQAFERAVELDPTNVAALADLFEYYLDAPGIFGGGEEKARKAAARLAELSPPHGRRAQAALFLKKKDYAAAEREFRQALKLEPDKAGRYLDLAAFLDDRGRHQEADPLLEKASEVAPQSAELLFARGKHLAVSGKDPAQARALLEQYLRTPRQPDDPTPSEVKKLLKQLGGGSAANRPWRAGDGALLSLTQCGAGFSLPGRDSSRPLSRRPAGAETSLGAARRSACATSTHRTSARGLPPGRLSGSCW
jgi:tetratricopeptide (TPR) repeat protein